MTTLKDLIKKEISLDEFEDLMVQFDENHTRKNITQIVFEPKNYGLMTTELDDYFSLCVRSKSKEALDELKEFLTSNNLKVMGSIDDFGMKKIEERFASVGPELITLLRSAAGKEEEKQADYGKNEFDEFYFYFMPFNFDLDTLEKSQKLIFNETLKISKKYKTIISFFPNQLDNTVLGTYIITPEDNETNPMEFILLTDMDDVRHAFITFSVLKEIGSREYINEHCSIQYLKEYVDCDYDPMTFAYKEINK